MSRHRYEHSPLIGRNARLVSTALSVVVLSVLLVVLWLRFVPLVVSG